MKQLNLHRQVKVLTVAGHNGIRGNYIAGELARKGTELVIGFFQKSMKAKMKDGVFREHLRRLRVLHTHLSEGLIHSRDLSLEKDVVRLGVGLLTEYSTLRSISP